MFHIFSIAKEQMFLCANLHNYSLYILCTILIVRKATMLCQLYRFKLISKNPTTSQGEMNSLHCP